MHESRVAGPYAKSILQLSNERGELEKVYADMKLFADVSSQNPAFVRIMRNPIISHDKKEGILNSLFRGRVSDMTMHLFQIITRKNREAYLYDIAKEFLHQYKVLKGIASAEVTTTYPLTDDQRQRFVRMVSEAEGGKKVELKEVTSQNIIGGFVLKLGDRQVDESIRTKLNRIKNKFTDSSYIAKL